MTTFERVTFRPEGGRARTIYVQDPVLAGAFFTAVEVDKEGEEVSGKDFDVRRHMISAELIVKRTSMVMNNTYGWLEERDSS